VARRPTNSQSSSPAYLTIARADMDRRLEERIARGQELLARPISSDDDLRAARGDFYTWSEYNQTLLRRSFSTSELADGYKRQASVGFITLGGGQPPLGERIDEFHEDVRRRVRRLSSIKDRLELYEERRLTPAPRSGQPAGSMGTTIFVVHGRSEAAKESVARFIQQASDLHPVILHEQPNSGQTVIEKFEDNAADAAFAIVLLTGDDEGGLLGSGEQRRRARQNVVFELGFFIGKLGRTRVAVLYEEDVELPSDMSGVLYTLIDQGGA
jgi:Predicted nucleotide-binding protein containing TIR-like domain